MRESACSAQSLLVVGLRRRIVFGHAQPHPDARVHVAVGDVMHDLPHRPAAVAIRRVELFRRQAADGGADVGRKLRKLSDAGLTIGWCQHSRFRELANWKSGSTVVCWFMSKHATVRGRAASNETFFQPIHERASEDWPIAPAALLLAPLSFNRALPDLALVLRQGRSTWPREGRNRALRPLAFHTSRGARRPIRPCPH